MKVKLLHSVRYSPNWVFNVPPIPEGAIVPVIPATNQPDYESKGLVWIDTDDLKDDPYGILLDKTDYEIVEGV